MSVQSFATIVTRPGSGRIVDARGAKPTLLRGLMLSSGAGCLYLASLGGPQAPLSLLVLLAGRLVLGVGECLLITAVLGWAIVRAGPDRAGRAMAWNGMAQYGALAPGAPVGFWLYQAHGFASVAVCTVVLPLLALAVVAPLDPVAPTSSARMPLRTVIRHIWRPGVGLLLAGMALMGC